MESFTKIKKIMIKELTEKILAIPGVAAFPEENLVPINIEKSNLGWDISLNIICFAYVNISSVSKQVQNQAKYFIEKNSNYADNVKVNVNVYDLIFDENSD